jgi:hypothetical protein
MLSMAAAATASRSFDTMGITQDRRIMAAVWLDLF